jgi:two-component system, OmpR family, response regulator
MSPAYSNELRIYLVEDSPDMRERLTECVVEGALGQVVGYADTEDDALTGILQHKPDTVIIDIQLRAGNGINVLRKLRALLPDSMPAVIMLTDYAITEFGRRATAYGAKYFLDKATGMKQLEALLRSLTILPRTSPP